MTGGWSKKTGGELNFFKFETPGDQLVGKWVGTRKNTRYDDKLNGVVLTKDDGLQVFYLSSALESLTELEVDIPVKIVFLGKEATKTGGTFKQFDVFTWDPKKVGNDPVTEHDTPVSEPFQAKDEDVPF